MPEPLRENDGSATIDGIEYCSRMFPTWRIASAKAVFQHWPRRAALGLASWIALLGLPAAVIGVAATVGFPSAATELVVGVWLLLMVTTVLVAMWLWVWRVSELARKETSARCGTAARVGDRFSQAA